MLQKLQLIIAVIIGIISILNFLFPQIPSIVKWLIGLLALILVINYVVPYFHILQIKLTEKYKQKKQNEIASRYFWKLKEIVDRFIILIDLSRSDAIFRVTQDILSEIDKGDEIFYKYNLTYCLYKAQLDIIKNLKQNADNLRTGICKLNFTINSFCQMYVDRAYPYLIESSIKISGNFKDNFNSTMSNFERLIQEFGDLCEKTNKDFTNMPSYSCFVVRKLQ
jgi:hypothetical protein